LFCGAWDKVRLVDFLNSLLAITGYGMATRTIFIRKCCAHLQIIYVHVGALAEQFMAFGMIYWLVPRIVKGPLFSTKCKLPFLDGGIILYTANVRWVSALSMWKQFNPEL
jgi:cytochrome c oxidase cbb3-type subunit I/II